MKAEDIMKMLKNSPDAEKRIPLHLRPTLPRLYFDGEWFAECFYYALVRKNNEFLMRAPQMKCVFRLSDMALVDEMPFPDGDIIGSIHDTLSAPAAKKQQEYLKTIENITESNESRDTLSELLACQGEAFAKWYKEIGGKKNV